MIGKQAKKLSYGEIREKMKHFLLNFEDPEIDEEIA